MNIDFVESDDNDILILSIIIIFSFVSLVFSGEPGRPKYLPQSRSKLDKLSDRLTTGDEIGASLAWCCHGNSGTLRSPPSLKWLCEGHAEDITKTWFPSKMYTFAQMSRSYEMDTFTEGKLDGKAELQERLGSGLA